ncbi:P-loop containing nucleoside triphosphate hydrolase protein [Coniophora puteana RWD-64-598 SS2]|uniref:P-loop containing nucleoside triphosphate hydrolase protein n=1 Tax=Coniophora puteana (strain RWD-64-598) TaxID=741705 RepID=A0A5M3N7A3_CONPW|nr:P-loop containing nucleoside triphosphate hydrolase protein [Coniophora puteana RWD-64-598 SS2]EIW87313.1 P-loop containing nucleoside triphosphate hydrolase protein [Coniophora puteana RWD-64-598 SS2]
MPGLFLRQFTALFWKNWIILSKHPFLNVVRCFILPVAYGIFLAVAQTFLMKPNNYGIGSPVPVYNFTTQFDGSLSLIWADATSSSSSPSASDIMSYITRDFSPAQLRAVRQVADPSDIPAQCPQNFNLYSECYAALAFNYLPTSPTDTNAVNYTISADGGLVYVNVYSHTSDFEERILPLQWAVDQALIELRSGQSVLTPLEWPYTQETNEQQATNTRLSYIRGLRTLLVLALFICYIGISYQLPGAFTGERANLITSHMKAMGLMDSARILSWHISLSLAYLPAWIIVSIIWHYRIFSKTNVGLVIAVHLLLGLSLASYTFFVAAPFGRSPQLAAVVSTFAAIVLAILALVFYTASTGAAFVFTLVFPPGFYIFAIRAMCGWENHLMATDVTRPDPDTGVTLLPILVAAIIDIFLWPWLGALWERRLYDARNPKLSLWARLRGRKKEEAPPHPDGVAISIRNLSKVFPASMFKREKGSVTAVSDLSLDIPKSGIFVLLGSNGAGKSTSLSIIANLLGRSAGSITFEGGRDAAPRGTLGIVPQKNVLFPELTCYQTLRVWRAIKHSDSPSSASMSETAAATDEHADDYAQLLRDCDLGSKIHANASTLSGGQKRKLQLAVGLVGGSRIVLVDECTSGVDPLSRRALWRTLTSVRHERTVVFTTHFLDEADLLADRIAILQAPGRLVAEGTPVALKSGLGRGYSVQVAFESAGDAGAAEEEKGGDARPRDVLARVRGIAPGAVLYQPAPTQASYQLQSKDSNVVEVVLQMLEVEKTRYGISSYDVQGTTIEDIFLDLMDQQGKRDSTSEKSLTQSTSDTDVGSVPPTNAAPKVEASAAMALTDGRPRSTLSQALTIFHKRTLVARRSWLTPLLVILVAVCGSCIPLFYLSGQEPSCTLQFKNETVIPLFVPLSPLRAFAFGSAAEVLTAPPGIASTLGHATEFLPVRNIADNASFVQTIQDSYMNITNGGVSIDTTTGAALVAWEASPPGLMGPTMMNLATNVLYNRALNASGDTAGTPSVIMANYAAFPPIAAGTLVDLKWIAFFGAAMAVFPAFFSLYVSRERRSAVQAMQLSNGLSDPIGLWLGHLLFDTIFSVVLATVIIIIFASVSNQFHGLGFFWVILVLYGITGALFAYCVSLMMTSPLASFAAVAGYQIIMYILYLAGYLLTLTYAKTSSANQIITIIHFTLSILSPVASVMRAAFVSVNLFSLLCNGTTPVTTHSLGVIMRYGGPILYLIIYSFVLMGILVWVDSGSLVPRRFLKTSRQQARLDAQQAAREANHADVAAEARAVETSDDSLRLLHVSKEFDGRRVVDDVTFGVGRDTIFAMLGPNGAGKTTTFNMIRGDIVPDAGDVLIKGVSVVNHPRSARLALGVCPQFTAIDAQLTVREHLAVYGRLKGLVRGPELNENVSALMRATALEQYADRLASELSGGNQRKLALAIALIGNPSVVLIDEFSTGIDAKIKREMWGTLRAVAVGKAVVITTHSMEEASALANKVGIISKQILAVGTTESLASRYATYQVHFSCPTREDVLRAQKLMARIPGARLADDVATRFEVPIHQDPAEAQQLSSETQDGQEGSEATASRGSLSLAQLFHILAEQGDFSEYTVEKATLESVFLKVIRENNVLEENEGRGPERQRRWKFW